ncbi:hypothetical protein PC119_g19985 [Phytophthora cactorum]|uniref:Uncharacterized protein n=1 Tax=Phytophthora cactorum TaxID=29920 RepID=A0A8T1C1M7_9STRA|nr:hypothetical protein PC114_g18623 [Phytophthora cactorum]KAG2913152.1 hypothetical protein PC117_g18671 [Phytophthora cactorum]KAG2986221.1 hypothetical protein PC119_g19985 [Phytophthora cactorum]
MGASPQGRCSFIALELVADRLGAPDWFSWHLVEQFYAERAARGAPISEGGVWSQYSAGLGYLLLAPGLYLVAGFAPYPARCSHAFVLGVTVTGRYASDDEAARVALVDYAYPWLGGLQFVRRLVLRR